jgi:hypothetical protein
MRPSILIFLFAFTALSACGETNVYDAGPGDTAQEIVAPDADTNAPDAPDATDGGEIATGDLGLDTAGDTPLTDAETPCVPVTCESLGFDCGAIDNQCGNTFSCGLCSPPNVCGGGGNALVCGCTPACGDKTCGNDGCGGSCGICADPAPNCNASGQCEEAPCTIDCEGKECGADGCGETCGFCDAGWVCDDADLCEETCVPVCDGKECGPDGCEGSCGECADEEICLATGKCDLQCTPNCASKECGSDGCGDSCGSCAPGEDCVSGSGGTMNCELVQNPDPGKDEA